MFVQDRNEARNYFFQVWAKYKDKLPLEPIEAIISDVILEHPEYHHYLDDKETSFNSDFKPEQNQTNPFLHMGMHIALKEQVSSDRPSGIGQIFNQLMTKSISIHDAEHKMMECLGQSLWEAQRNNVEPDESSYLESLKRIS
ncbi:MAG TPA: DUF1841 family protein [Thiotrichaceae bacterium]|jgi:hypothetical protein|nr:DUF1841 family protein [Thiotrichaceae bacterium]HIM07486.1 DUF1841 family protein [Gammaproteobacteria bacterium]